MVAVGGRDEGDLYQTDLLCYLIMYSDIEHENSIPFQFVPDPFLARALSFSVSFSYMTSESGY